MAAYDFSNIKSAKDLENRILELESKAGYADKWLKGVKDEGTLSRGQQRLQGYRDEREALFNYGAAGNVPGLYQAQTGQELTAENPYQKVNPDGSMTPYLGNDGKPATSAASAYNVYDDPFYQQALQGAQSEFNLARTDALASKQYQERPIQRELEERPGVAEQQRRRLAGNFAARGMGGGRYGALTRAEAEMNAREITNRTGLREQIAELGRQFTSRFGAEGTDWLGTREGYQAQQQALQAALNNRLAGLTTVG